MSNQPPLPMRLQLATFSSTCPDCGRRIDEGDRIGQFGTYEPYVCPSCVDERLVDYINPDPVTEVILQVRDEARLRRLLDLEMGQVTISLDEDDEVAWTETPTPDCRVVARIEVVDDVFLITRPFPLEPFVVTDQ